MYVTRLFIIFFLMIPFIIFSKNSDSINRNVYLNLQIGHTESLFLENYKGNQHANTNIFSTISAEITVRRWGLNFVRNNYAKKYELPIGDLYRGYVLYRRHKTLDFGIKFYPILKKKGLDFYIGSHCSWRPEDGETIIIEKNLLHLTGETYFAWAYAYRSIGLGVSTGFRKEIWKNFYISSNLIYTHYFQKTNQYESMRKWGKDNENYLRNYVVNKNLLSLSLEIGYKIRLFDISKL